MVEISHYKFCHLKLQWPDGNYDENRVNLMIGIHKLFIKIPLWKADGKTDWSKDSDEYGVSAHDDVIWFNWGQKRKTFDLPWQLVIHNSDLLYPNGDLFHRNQYLRGKRFGNQLHWYSIDSISTKISTKDYGVTFPFRHTTKSGEVQECMVTLRGEEREWRRKWLMWLPCFNLVKRDCEFCFTKEMGERAGEWKGGLMAASTEWRKGETLKDAFYRWYNNWDGK